ncbi:MAG: hypothetical protein AB7O32_11825 [Vicinamibacterales bacterium]
MAAAPQRAHISEFVTLVAHAFATDESAAETVVRAMLVRLMAAAPEGGMALLFDAVPGARDLAFAGLIADPEADWLIERAARPGPRRTSWSTPGQVSPDLFVFFLAYCSAHAGPECSDQILAAARPFMRLERPRTGY